MQRLKMSGKLCLLASIVLLFAVLMLCGFTTQPKYASANAETVSEETESPADGAGADETPAEPAPAPDQGGEDTETHTFLSRVQEWFEDNLSEFFSGATLVTAFSTVAAVIVSWRKNKKLKAATDALLAGVQEKTDSNTEVNGKVIEAINQLIEKYNAVQEYILALDKKELTRDAVCEEMATFGKTILEILATVYANNQNIPQGVKDLVTLKYSQALRAENNLLAPTDPAEGDGGDGEE